MAIKVIKLKGFLELMLGIALSLMRAARKLLRPAARRTVSNRDLGDAARDRRDWEEAAAHYQHHVNHHPEDFAIWVQLGHMLKEAGAHRSASLAYLNAFRLRGDDPDLLLNIGHIAKLRGLLRSAALAYRHAYEIEPGTDVCYELSSSQLRKFLPNVSRRFVRSQSTRSLHHMGPLEHKVGEIEHVDGWRIRGWAIDPGQRELSAKVSFFVGGKLLCETEVDEFRFDIDSMGYGSALAGFSAELPLDLSSEKPIKVTARLSRTGEELSGSPFSVSAPPNIANWLQRKSRVRDDERGMIVARNNALTDGLLSIIMPVYNTREEWLVEAVESVLTQWCDRWELICVDDHSSDLEVGRQLAGFAARDDRIRVITLDANQGIAAATNVGIEAARGDFVAFMDHDDYIEPDAVFRILDAVTSEVDFLYSDEAVTSENINVIRSIAARPAFSHDYYLSHPYFVHLNAARRSVAREIGGWDETMSISADVDFVFRMIEVSRSIAHVSAVLYRWRTHERSTGHTSRGLVTAATIGALQRHLDRTSSSGKVSEGCHFNTYRVDYPDDRGATLIIIPTKNAHELVDACLKSIWRTIDPQDDVHVVIIDHQSDSPSSREFLKSLAGDRRISIVPYAGPFNYARMNNVAVQAMPDRFKYVLFMNNDVEAIERGWLERMRGLAGRRDVGVVGASLIYGNRTYQHSGVVMGLGDLVDHAHKFAPFLNQGGRNLGYNCSLVSTRDYLAVTGACMILERSLFLSVGGFDETLEIGYNDTDLCLRIGTLGLKVLNDAYAVLYHHESITRKRVGSMDHPDDYWRFKRRWGHILVAGDPFYNHALLPKGGQDHQIGDVTDVWVAPRVRKLNPTILHSKEGTPQGVEKRA